MARPTGQEGGSPAQVPRAPRYSLRIPLRFRSHGDRRWRQGLAENISRSGILFCTDLAPPLETPLELKLHLPEEITGQAPTSVQCHGQIVRMALPQDPKAPTAVAATFSAFTFIPEPEPSER